MLPRTFMGPLRPNKPGETGTGGAYTIRQKIPPYFQGYEVAHEAIMELPPVLRRNPAALGSEAAKSVDQNSADVAAVQPPSLGAPSFIPEAGYYQDIEPHPSAQSTLQDLRDAPPQPKTSWKQRLLAGAVGGMAGLANSSPSSRLTGRRIPPQVTANAVRGILHPNYDSRRADWENKVQAAKEQVVLDENARDRGMQRELNKTRMEGYRASTAASDARRAVSEQQLARGDMPDRPDSTNELLAWQLADGLASPDPIIASAARKQLDILSMKNTPAAIKTLQQLATSLEQKLHNEDLDPATRKRIEDNLASTMKTSRGMGPPLQVRFPPVGAQQYEDEIEVRRRADAFFAQAEKLSVDRPSQHDKAIELAASDRAASRLLQKDKNTFLSGESKERTPAQRLIDHYMEEELRNLKQEGGGGDQKEVTRAQLERMAAEEGKTVEELEAEAVAAHYVVVE